MSCLRCLVPAVAFVLLCAPLARAQGPAAPPPAEPAPAAPTDAPPDEAEREEEEEAPRPGARPVDEAKERDALKREVLDDVKRELERTKEEIRTEISYVESEADARSYDAEQLRELKQTVNLLQLHGYFRFRGDLFNKADLGRGADPSGNVLFPNPGGTDYLGSANMRLRLNPVLRVSDDIALYGQFDVLDNVIAGSGALSEGPFGGDAGVPVLSNRVAGSLLRVKRVWAEVETPFGQLAFGRKGVHFGEGMVYNDGNCLDCDHGTTFDRAQLTVGPFFNGHLFTFAADAIGTGPTSADVRQFDRFGNLGQPLDLEQLDDGYRFSLQVTRMAQPADVRRRLDNGEWVLQWGLLGAYRTQHSVVPAFIDDDPATTSTAHPKIAGQFGEADAYLQVLYRKLRLATEWAGFYGRVDNRIGTDVDGNVVVFPGQEIDFLQFAGVLRGQYAFLKQDSLLASVDFGFASGDDAPGMGARPAFDRNSTSNPGDIEAPQLVCNAGGCSDDRISNFRMNPDFRVDQLLWRNLFTQVTDAWFARAEARFKPGGRASGGADDDGFEFSAAAIYSQAVYAASTPGGEKPLGIELNGAATYTSKDRFFAGVVAGLLVPLGGLDSPASDASSAQVYRGILGVTF